MFLAVVVLHERKKFGVDSMRFSDGIYRLSRRLNYLTLREPGVAFGHDDVQKSSESSLIWTPLVIEKKDISFVPRLTSGLD